MIESVTWTIKQSQSVHWHSNPRFDPRKHFLTLFVSFFTRFPSALATFMPTYTPKSIVYTKYANRKHVHTEQLSCQHTKTKWNLMLQLMPNTLISLRGGDTYSLCGDKPPRVGHQLLPKLCIQAIGIWHISLIHKNNVVKFIFNAFFVYTILHMSNTNHALFFQYTINALSNIFFNYLPNNGYTFFNKIIHK